MDGSSEGQEVAMEPMKPMKPMMPMMPRLLVALAAAALTPVCGDTHGPLPGAEGGPCLTGGQCSDPALVCASGLCVQLPDAWPPAPGGRVSDAGADHRARGDGGSPIGEWVTFEAGSFQMGSPAGERCREPLASGKETRHRVYLTRAFEIMVTEVTQGQFLALMGYNPATFFTCGAGCPVETVNWHQAAAYCNALSDKKGLRRCYSCEGSGLAVTCVTAPSYAGKRLHGCPGYRLPTEAEWELAYRGGTRTAFHNGGIKNCTGPDTRASAIGWYNINSGIRTHPVAWLDANHRGLFDMAGNVHEWCHDWFRNDLGSTEVQDPSGPASGTSRVTRGGGVASDPQSLRAAFRWDQAPFKRLINVGFRVVRSLP
jgi:formylglycine-generating enzyme required for sulfatase activity